MSTNNPFDPSQDPDATQLVPTPGGRRAAAPVAAAAAPVSAPELTDVQALRPGSGLNPLAGAANALLGLIVPLRTMTQPPNIEELRQRLALAVNTFERDARAAAVDPEAIAAARYALCTVLDETIASTAWGNGVWGSGSLLVTFHNEASGGEKFFLILQRLSQNLRANLDLIELMYLCLALGMEGRYRLIDRGQEQLAALRERLQQLISEQRGRVDPELSPHWRGMASKASSPMRGVPLWVMGVAAGGLLVALHLGYGRVLSRDSDPVYASLHHVQVAAPTQAPPAPMPVPMVAPPVRLAGFLAEDIAAGKVTVDETPDRSVVTLMGEGMFGPGAAVVNAGVEPLLGRIGTALDSVPGKVMVIGHTDNSKPGLSARYPSNYDLSKARADSVLGLLALRAGPASRFSAEGRGDTEPLVPNDTSSNRSRNRRVQVIVVTPTLAQ